LLPVAEVQGLKIQQGDAVRARLNAAFQKNLDEYCLTHQGATTRA